MVYILGTRNREYNIEGVTLPKKSYNEREIELGKRSVVGIDDGVYSRLAANKIFQSLVKSGDILIRDKPPEGQETPAELRQKLLQNRDESSKRIAELEDLVRQLQDTKTESADVVEVRKEALAEIAKRDARIAKLEALLAEYEEEDDNR